MALTTRLKIDKPATDPDPRTAGPIWAQKLLAAIDALDDASVITVSSRGGDVTGAVDCSTAYQTACTDAAAAKGIVLFTPGTYLQLGAVTVSSGVRVFGSGQAVTTINQNIPSGTGGAFLITAGGSGVVGGVEVAHLTIDCGTIGDYGVQVRTGTNADATNYISKAYIHDVTVKNAHFHNVMVWPTSWDTTCERVTSIGGYTGFNVQGWNTNPTNTDDAGSVYRTTLRDCVAYGATFACLDISLNPQDTKILGGYYGGSNLGNTANVGSVQANGIRTKFKGVTFDGAGMPSGQYTVVCSRWLDMDFDASCQWINSQTGSIHVLPDGLGIAPPSGLGIDGRTEGPISWGTNPCNEVTIRVRSTTTITVKDVTGLEVTARIKESGPTGNSAALTVTDCSSLILSPRITTTRNWTITFSGTTGRGLVDRALLLGVTTGSGTINGLPATVVLASYQTN